MNVRTLFPWLLVGALIASAYGNFVMYRSANASAATQTQSSHHGTGGVFSAHVAGAAPGEHCPTLDILGLSEDQRAQIRRCSLSSLDVRTNLAVKIESASAELEALLSKDVMDSERILELADEISDLRTRQYRAWIGTILVVRDVLTPAQLQHLHELKSN